MVVYLPLDYMRILSLSFYVALFSGDVHGLTVGLL